MVKNNIVNVGSYTYKVPEDYIYDKESNGLLIYDAKDTFRIYIKTVNGSYENMSGAKLSIKESIKENGSEVFNIRELNISEMNFLIVETMHMNKNRLVVFADASNDYVYYIEIVDIDNNFNYDIIKIAADIVKNATFEEKNTNMEKIPVNDVSSLAIKASLEYKALVSN